MCQSGALAATAAKLEQATSMGRQGSAEACKRRHLTKETSVAQQQKAHKPESKERWRGLAPGQSPGRTCTPKKVRTSEGGGGSSCLECQTKDHTQILLFPVKRNSWVFQARMGPWGEVKEDLARLDQKTTGNNSGHS